MSKTAFKKQVVYLRMGAYCQGIQKSNYNFGFFSPISAHTHLQGG